jgi:phenylacetate-coenzyme A ligase PaaK-like adenylate-forming protein
MEARFFDLPVYGLSTEEKTPLLLNALSDLTRHHAQHCPEYGRLLHAFGVDAGKRPDCLEDFLPLTVRQFKQHQLKSIPDEAVFKTLYSSGTSGTPSTIYLDKEAATNQTKALVKIMQHWLGKQRLPMLIADHACVIKDRNRFSARGAGIQGMAMLGRDHTYALNEDMSFNVEAVSDFATRYQNEPVLLFGFTYMVWQYFLEPLLESGIRLPQGILLHGGGWKKLQDQSVDNTTFKARMSEAGIQRVHNYYGMVEQTGSIFIECEHGHMHAPVYADVIIRDPLSGQSLGPGETGILELLSVLPDSYPGHILLTEDMGRFLGEDDCSCGRKGRYFEILGRIPRAEARGCSDTFTAEVA